MSPGRLHALIDGVFAIAITLLVLDLPHPEGSHGLVRSLADEWPTYIAYLVSFATVGLIWIEHHGMMSGVRAINRRFLERTLVFLLFVSVIPWPTSLAASYADTSQARPAAILYALTMMCMGLAFAECWRYLGRHPELVEPAALPAFSAGTRRAVLGGCAYLVAIAIALVSPLASFAADALIAVYFAISATDVPALLLRRDA